MSSPETFEALMRTHQDRVYATAWRLTGGSADAEDLAQQAFLRAWEHFADLENQPEASQGAWLRTTTTRLCLNHLQRYRNRWRFFSELSRQDDEDDSPSDFAAQIADEHNRLPGDSKRELLDLALARLPDSQRIPLILFHYEDLPYDEIARQLGVSLAKVKTDILRGREKLRTLLTETLPAEGARP
jgi:RNA polymerase sigma-70 factor (ECF subfamily)